MTAIAAGRATGSLLPARTQGRKKAPSRAGAAEETGAEGPQTAPVPAGRAAAVPRAAGDFFVCDILDALPKDDMASMEHPLFSLSTRPDRRILNYTHNGVEVTVVPSVKGLATLFDKDILIYCISQLMAALNAGREVTRHLRLTAHDLLVATCRETSGDGYQRLREAFERLAGTRITTNAVTGGVEVTAGFFDGFDAGQQVVIGVQVFVEAGDLRGQLGQHRHIEHAFECIGRV